MPCRLSTTAVRLKRAAVLGLLATLPFIAIRWAQHRLVPVLTETFLENTRPLSRALAQLALSRQQAARPKAGRGVRASAQGTKSPTEASPIAQVRAAPKPPSSRHRGILLSKERVLHLARAGIRPSGFPQAATRWRPAGLALHGVSALGVGLHDGDVITRVGGRAARSENAVIGSVAAALRSGAPSISAEVWRHQQVFLLTAELPILPDDSSGAEPNERPGTRRSFRVPAPRHAPKVKRLGSLPMGR